MMKQWRRGDSGVILKRNNNSMTWLSTNIMLNVLHYYAYSLCSTNVTIMVK